jgi:hypothetical protein
LPRLVDALSALRRAIDDPNSVATEEEASRPGCFPGWWIVANRADRALQLFPPLPPLTRVKFRDLRDFLAGEHDHFGRFWSHYLPGPGGEERDELLAFLDDMIGRVRSCGAPGGAPTVTVWHHGGRSYSIDGHAPVVVSRTEAIVLTAFMEARAALDTRALENRIDHVSRILKNLRLKFPGAVRAPGGKKGVGYYICVRAALAK